MTLMKTITGILTCITLHLANSVSYGWYAHVNGPNYACPGSELHYYYTTNMPTSDVTFTITNGKIFNIFSQTWETAWTFSQSANPNLNETYPFRVKWDNDPIGTLGNVKVEVEQGWSVFGNRQVTLGPSPGTPTIVGETYLLNCQGQERNYTVSNIPESWQFIDWNLSSQLQQVGSSDDPITVKAASTTYQGMETLTGVFHFITDGNMCGTRNANKNIWVGKPSPAAKTVDGFPYSSGYQICPGNHWVGITWNGQVTSTAWTVTPGISYSTNNNECDFYLPSSGFSSVAITVNGTNACGTSYNASYYLSKKTFGCGSLMVAVYPNPAKDELTVQTSLLNDNESLHYEIAVDEIVLLDKANKKLITRLPSKSTVKLDTKNIPEGEYFMHIKFGTDVIMRHILIGK
jgi:hypothetical protein